MTEADSYLIELALQKGFDPHDDGDETEGSDTYVVKARDLVSFIKMLSGPAAWECKDYADGWIRFDRLKDALFYQFETGCIMRPVYA